jgi:hypothetical protein
VPSAFSVILSPGRAGATDIAPCGALNPARDKQPAREQRFGERHRGRVRARDAQHRKPVGKLRARAAAVFRDPRERQPGIGKRLPQRSLPGRRCARC